MQTLVWMVVLAALGLLVVALAIWALQVRSQRAAVALPTDWLLVPRPVFSVEERRVYRLLREALPHHVVLSKLPLVRFCQPGDPAETRFWFDLLGAIHVTFVVCSPNGRVLAAVDLDTERGVSRRAQRIKHSVLTACRVRYMRCPLEHLPSVAEIQLLVPQSGSAIRGPLSNGQGAHRFSNASANLSNTVAHRRAERSALWQDSSLFQDSFFAPDVRVDAFGQSDFGGHGENDAAASQHAKPGLARGGNDDDIAGVVVDTPTTSRPTHH
ncbi:MAG: DUF2726 domain-containing protein [Burkholderiaceae bacterium]